MASRCEKLAALMLSMLRSTFLFGAPEVVEAPKRKAYLSGLAAKQIFTDAFLPSKSAPTYSHCGSTHSSLLCLFLPSALMPLV
jgi:hypothetical protein